MGVPGSPSSGGISEQRIEISSMFQVDEDLRSMVLRFRSERSTFLEMFDQGFQKYI